VPFRFGTHIKDKRRVGVRELLGERHRSDPLDPCNKIGPLIERLHPTLQKADYIVETDSP
jgi:hypothetical protein